MKYGKYYRTKRKQLSSYCKHSPITSIYCSQKKANNVHQGTSNTHTLKIKVQTIVYNAPNSQCSPPWSTCTGSRYALCTKTPNKPSKSPRATSRYYGSRRFTAIYAAKYQNEAHYECPRYYVVEYHEHSKSVHAHFIMA